VIDPLIGAPFVLSISPDPLLGGEQGNFSVEHATPNLATYLIYGLAGPGSTYVPQLGITLDLAAPVLGAPRWPQTRTVPSPGSGRCPKPARQSTCGGRAPRADG